MNNEPEPGSKPDPEIERLRALSQLPQARLDNNFYIAVDELKTAIEAMDITFHGIEIDRATFPQSSDQETRRRWEAHILMLRNLHWAIERKTTEIHEKVRTILAID